MGTGGWLDDIVAEGEIVRTKVHKWRYQYARVTPEFLETFDPLDPDIIGETVVEGEDVVRRILVQIKSYEWPGLTETAADTLADTLFDLPAWGPLTWHRGTAGQILFTAE